MLWYGGEGGALLVKLILYYGNIYIIENWDDGNTGVFIEPSFRLALV